MTIEEKRQAIKEHCKTNEDCSYCDLCYIDKNCWHIANNGSDEDVEKIYEYEFKFCPECSRLIVEE